MTTTKDPSVWQVETLRMTAFPIAAPEVSSIKWWETVAREPPETKTLQPRAGTLQEVGRIQSGLCTLALECRSQRIDWLFSPILSHDRELESFPTFATLPEGLKLYKEMLLPWLGQCPPSSRLAFGAVLVRPVESRKAAYEMLAEYLPSVKLDPENSSDFSYQINRPRASGTGITNLQLNRLSRWTAVRLSGMLVEITAGQPTPRVFESHKELQACRTELDINTSQKFSAALPQERFPALLEELVELAIEIAAKGDIP